MSWGEFDAYMRVEELTLPLLEELIEHLQWRVRIVKARLEQAKDDGSMGPVEFSGVPIEHRDRNIRRLLLLARNVLEKP